MVSIMAGIVGVLSFAGFATGPSYFGEEQLPMDTMAQTHNESTALVPYNLGSREIVALDDGSGQIIVPVSFIQAAGATALTAATLLSRSRPIAVLAGRISQNISSIAPWVGLISGNETSATEVVLRNAAGVVRWTAEESERMAFVTALGASYNNDSDFPNAALVATTVALGIKIIKDLTAYVTGYLSNTSKTRVEMEKLRRENEELQAIVRDQQAEKAEHAEVIRELEEVVELKNGRIIDVAKDNNALRKGLEKFAKTKVKDDVTMIYLRAKLLPQIEDEYVELDTDLVSLKAILSHEEDSFKRNILEIQIAQAEYKCRDLLDLRSRLIGN